MSTISTLVQHLPIERSYLLEYLHCVQDEYHCISRTHMEDIAKLLNLSLSEVFEVATFYHHFQVMEVEQLPENKTILKVCTSLACQMHGGDDLLAQAKTKYGNKLRVMPIACLGRCQYAPVALLGDNPLDNADVKKLKQALTTKNYQAPIISDYLNFTQYRQQGGYQTLFDCLTNKTPEAVIEILKQSELRGLGGAGFPGGIKWESVRQEKGEHLLLINIDESEVGTFKDRYYLESNPHQFIEGALIAAWAIDASDIYLYLRNEYTSARQILIKELAELGAKLDYSLPKVHLRRGAGAYICGEESAMTESVEGKRGMPRLKPPRLSQVGLFGLPTLEHNLETLHWVPVIIKNGADWYHSLGIGDFIGSRTFSISGRVNKPGVYVVANGISLNKLIDEHCGGMLDGHQLKAFFVGGSCGGVLPLSAADEVLDFGILEEKYNSFIGSMAIIVLSDQDSVKDSVINVMRFLRDESCGQCTPCRVGTAKSVELLQQNSPDTDLLESLCVVMADASICGLGQAAPNPIRSLIKYFPEELK